MNNTKAQVQIIRRLDVDGYFIVEDEENCITYLPFPQDNRGLSLLFYTLVYKA